MADQFPRVVPQPPSIHGMVADHEHRIFDLESSLPSVIVGVWITVGTPGVDGVDGLIAANPAPYNVTPWVPFQNGWTNRLGANDYPVQFKLTPDNWIRIRGVAVSGSAGLPIFTLPVGYRPTSFQPMDQRSTNAGHYVELTVQSDGEVVYEQEV